MTTEERLAAKHKATLTRGQWCRCSGLETEAAAQALADDLEKVHFQVRHVVKDEKSGKYVVVFR